MYNDKFRLLGKVHCKAFAAITKADIGVVNLLVTKSILCY
jgi:hypothetical protein